MKGFVLSCELQLPSGTNRFITGGWTTRPTLEFAEQYVRKNFKGCVDEDGNLYPGDIFILEFDFTSIEGEHTMAKPIETTLVVVERKDGETATYDVELTKDEMDDMRINLRYSKTSDRWTDKVRGKVAVRVYDHGNGIRLRLREQEEDINLNYAEIEELSVILAQYDRIRGDVASTKVFKQVD